jgi:hypothetical protein
MRAFAVLLRILGAVLLFSSIALFLKWLYAHEEMNHAGIFLLLGSLLAGLVGLLLLMLGILLKPPTSGGSSDQAAA